MKKVISGTRYDTEKATLVGEANNIGRGADSTTDHKWWDAGLYRAPRSGRFFLAGRGGPMTIFGYSVGNNSWSGGEDIIPLSEEDAQAWAEENLPTETVETYFSVEDA